MRAFSSKSPLRSLSSGSYPYRSQTASQTSLGERSRETHTEAVPTV